jgi:hypothetical protein
MIRTQENFGLEGAFKVDIYNEKDELTDSTEYFSNFITQSGLKYLKTYSFPDCFRFLSLGQGTVANSATGNAAAFRTETTGLQDPVNTNGNITVDDLSTQSLLFMGRDFYFGGSNGACGTIATKQGPILYRGWSIPTGGKLTNAAVSINEFMVSPSSGNDSSGNAAFSRVVRSVVIPAQSRSIISYQLQARIQNTGITVFNSGTFQTGQANVDNDLGIVKEWENQSGYYRQIHHGLRCVDIEGSTYVPKWGDGMEPSRVSVDDIKCYFSPDNSQFDVNPIGGSQSSESEAYAADGLSKVYFGQNLSEDAGRAGETDADYYKIGDLPLTSIPTSATNDLPSNIRYSSVTLPDPSGYTGEFNNIDFSSSSQNHLALPNSISIATPGSSGYDSEKIDFGERVVASSLTINLPFEYSGFRTQRLSRKMFFTPVNSLGHNARFGSFVMAYKNGSTYYPYVDALLYDNSGRATMQHYRSVYDMVITDSGSGISVGSIKPNVGKVYGGFTTSQDSLGRVTGVSTSGARNYGIADHSLAALSAPAQTGELWWKHVSHGEVIRPTMHRDGSSSSTYSQSGLTIKDTSGYFDSGEQMIANLVFNHVEQDNWSVPLNHAWAHDYPNKGTVETGASETRWNGFYLTTLQFTGGSGISIIEGAVNEEAFEGHVGLGSARFSNLRFTGYLGHRDDITSKCLPGTVTLSSLPSTYLKTFSPDFLNLNMKFKSGGSDKTTQGIRIVNSFSGTGTNVSILAERLSGSGFGYSYGDKLSFGFTGLIDDTVSGNDKAVYLTSFTGNQLSSPQYNWMGHSYHTGVVLMSSMRPFSGNYSHSELRRLLPNYARPNPDFAHVDYPVDYGGTYPALSFDNTLEMYMDIVWSAQCGSALDCEEPA